MRRRRRVRLGLWTEEGVERNDGVPSEGSSSEAEADDVDEVDDDRSSGLMVMHVVRVYTVSVGKDRMPSVAALLLLVLASLELAARG